MGIKLEDLLAKGYRVTNEHFPERSVSNPKPQYPASPALGQAACGKKEGGNRIVVRFVSFRTRLLDPDNISGGSKFLLDCLRYAGLIPGDEPDKIIFITEQVKVAHRQDERTEIELTDEKTIA